MKSDRVQLYVLIILILQAATTGALWILNVLSVNTTGVFEVLLAANLVAFAIIIQAYRNPDSIARATDDETKPGQPAGPVPAGSQMTIEPAQAHAPVGAALPQIVHVAIPILSILVLIAFAAVLFLPSDKDAIPPTSTEVYIPVYLLIVVAFVLGSMYLFKRLMDTESLT